MRLSIYGIPTEELTQMRRVADLAMRGIAYPPFTQYKRLEQTPAQPNQGRWGRINQEATALESDINKSVV